MFSSARLRRRTVRFALAVFVVTTCSLLSFQQREQLKEQGTRWLQHYQAAKLTAAWRPTDSGFIDKFALDLPLSRPEYADDGKAKPVRDDAHTLTGADDFHDHFAAVTAMEGLTFQQAKAPCDVWGPDEYVNFMFAPDDPWVLAPTGAAVIRGRRREWQNWVRTRMIPWETVRDRHSGRGIVIVGGNHNTVERIKVILHALLKLNSTMHVEIHYWDDEISEKRQAGLKLMYPPGLFFNDLSKPHNVMVPRRLAFGMPSYGFKPAALVNTKFAEPLLLDADNVPVMKPESLYDSYTYRTFHSVFWPDICRTRPQNPIWAVTNTACRIDEYEQESGQLMVDVTRYWYHLQLAAWMASDEGPAWYNRYLLGDKDCYRFAWHALKTAYGKPKRWLASAGTLNEWTGEDGSANKAYCGYDFAQHHPDDGEPRVAFMHGGLLKTVHPELLKWEKDKGGVMRAYKRSPFDTDPRHNVRVGLRWDSTDYFPNELRGPKFAAPSCTDMEDVEARDTQELLPDWEEFFTDVYGYWLLARPDLEPPY